MASAIAAGAFVILAKDDKYPGEWDERVADLAEYVEDERGLQFDHPVYVDFLTSEEYADRTRTENGDLSEEDTAALDEGLGWFRALGLASGEVDILEATNDMADSGTLAYYDPMTERVTVRGTEMSVNLEVTLVHELTHALQDQHFDLERDLTPDEEPPTSAEEADIDSAFRSLVEGDAVRVENEYLFSLPSDEQDEYFAEYGEDVSESEEGLAEVPPAMQAYQLYPYAFGQPLAELLAADGGNDEVDEAFRDPPSTTEHMLDPRSFLDGDEPTGVDYPKLPDDVDEESERGPFGAVDVFFVLAERIDPLTALDGAEGWGDGLWITYEQDERTCMRMALDGDTPEDDAQLRSGFDAWAQAMPAEANATITDLGDGRFQVETCDPGPDAAPGNDRALDVMNLPASRAQLMLEGLNAGATVEEAWDAGDCVIRELTYDQVVEANTSVPSDETQDAIDAALETCIPAR